MYPKLLPWKAKKAGVPESVAKQIWLNTIFAAEMTGNRQQFETINRLFDTQLSIAAIPYNYVKTITDNIKTIHNTIVATTHTLYRYKEASNA
jgi:hypothetical protein